MSYSLLHLSPAVYFLWNLRLRCCSVLKPGPLVICSQSLKPEWPPSFPRASLVKGGNSTHAQVSGRLSIRLDRFYGKAPTSGPGQVHPLSLVVTCSEGRPFPRPFSLPVLVSTSPSEVGLLSPILLADPLGRSRPSRPSPVLLLSVQAAATGGSTAEPLCSSCPQGALWGRGTALLQPGPGWRWAGGARGRWPGVGADRMTAVSPGLGLRLDASTLVMAGPARVRAPRGPGSGLGRDRAGCACRGGGAPTKRGPRSGCLRHRQAAASQPCLMTRANAFGCGVLKTCSRILRSNGVII